MWQQRGRTAAEDQNRPAGRAAPGGELLLLLLQAPSLDLTLRSPAAAPAAPAAVPAAEYQSVCTLEKVKSALERAGAHRETRRREPPASSASSTTTTSSAKRRRRESTRDDELEGESRSSSSSSSAVLQGGDQPAAASVSGDAMAAAACPTCLCYVLVSRSNPGCPRCRSTVPLPAAPPSSPPAPPPTSLRTLIFF